MGYDNQDRCMAIGYYEQEENDDVISSFVHEPTWYVIAKWNKADEEVSLQFYMLDILPVNINVDLLGNLDEKNSYKLIDSKVQNEDKYHYIDINKDVFLTKNQLILSYSYVNKDSNEIVLRKENLRMSDFVDFMINNMNETSKKQINTVTAFPWLNKTYIEEPLLKNWMDKYGKSVDEDCYDASLLDTNFIVEVERFGSLVVLCNETGYNSSSTLWKNDGDNLIPVKISSEILEQDNDIIDQNMVTGFSLDEMDKYMFRATFRGRNLGDCGGQYTFVFNGQQFEIIEHAEMPKCANIYHWIKLYEKPIFRQ